MFGLKFEKDTGMSLPAVFHCTRYHIVSREVTKELKQTERKIFYSFQATLCMYFSYSKCAVSWEINWRRICYLSHYNTVKFSSLHITAWEVEVSVQSQSWYSAPGEETVEGLVQGPNCGGLLVLGFKPLTLWAITQNLNCRATIGLYICMYILHVLSDVLHELIMNTKSSLCLA